MVRDNGFPRGNGSSMGSSFPFWGMPQYIPFDEKNTKKNPFDERFSICLHMRDEAAEQFING